MLLIASHRFALIGICLAMAWAEAGFALPSRSVASNEAEVARCISQAARGQVWLEKTLWGLRDQEGGWLGAEIQNSDGSHDLGPLQINSWWVPKLADLLHRPPAHVHIWLRDDPCFNAEAARWIFVSALTSSQDYWRAIGIYHSPRSNRQHRYALSVAIKLRLRFGTKLFSLNDRK